jgi:hypothetical protein
MASDFSLLRWICTHAPILPPKAAFVMRHHWATHAASMARKDARNAVALGCPLMGRLLQLVDTSIARAGVADLKVAASARLDAKRVRSSARLQSFAVSAHGRDL